MTSLLDRRLLVVTGKGGTGKTTTAAALARLAAKAGKRVLLCEVDATGDIGEPFGAAPGSVDFASVVDFEPQELEPGIFVMSMDTQKALQEYLTVNLKVPFVARLGSFGKAFDFIAAAAPGVREILIIGKLCWEVKRANYDLVIADAAATGHVVSQLASPQAIGELVTVGPLRGQTAWMRETLADPTRTGVVLVATPEEMPVSETIDLAGRLHRDTEVSVAAVVVNRVLPELFVRSEVGMFQQLQTPQMRSELARHVPGNSQAVIEAAVLANALRRTQARHLDELGRELPAHTPMLFVPQAFEAGDSRAMVNFAVDALLEEMDC